MPSYQQVSLTGVNRRPDKGDGSVERAYFGDTSSCSGCRMFVVSHSCGRNRLKPELRTDGETARLMKRDLPR